MHFIRIDIDTPPSGATHFNPSMALPFEKHENEKVYVWDGKDWSEAAARKSGYKIRTQKITRWV